MKNRNLSNKGLSLSQAQSISNLCHQRALEIDAKLETINNYSKRVMIIDGSGAGKYHTLKIAKPIPDNLIELLEEKSKLHACQSFLMENIKLKSFLLEEQKSARPNFDELEIPTMPIYVDTSKDLLPNVDENYGWSKLTNKEYNEFLDAEAHASHIGQYIHKNGYLSRLRNELTNLPDIEWIEIEKDKKTPVEITKHHTSEQLLGYHEELSKLHRQYNQRVNYYKAKVKNITTEKNAEIAKHNADIQADAAKFNNILSAEYGKMLKDYEGEVHRINSEFEIQRQKEISRIAGLRIDVDQRFQNIIDMFLNDVKEE